MSNKPKNVNPVQIQIWSAQAKNVNCINIQICIWFPPQAGGEYFLRQQLASFCIKMQTVNMVMEYKRAKDFLKEQNNNTLVSYGQQALRATSKANTRWITPKSTTTKTFSSSLFLPPFFTLQQTRANDNSETKRKERIIQSRAFQELDFHLH